MVPLPAPLVVPFVAFYHDLPILVSTASSTSGQVVVVAWTTALALATLFCLASSSCVGPVAPMGVSAGLVASTPAAVP